MKIEAAVARAYGDPLRIEDLVLAGPRADEIVVRLVASGVASVDHKAIVGELAIPLPFVPGSEGAGIIEHVGEGVVGLAAGDAVIVGYASCGACEPCDAANPRSCLDFAALNLGGRRADGSAPFDGVAGNAAEPGPVNGFFFGQSSFATHLVCRAASAVKLQGGAPLEILACLGGELLIGAATIATAFALDEGDTLLVTGADAVGLLACMVAKARGAGLIIVADPDEARRALASLCGATLAVRAGEDLAVDVKSLVADGVRFAIDTTGRDDILEGCLASLAVTGTLACLQPFRDVAAVEAKLVEGQKILRQRDIKASPKALLAELAAFQAAGTLPIDRIVTFFPFEQVNAALEALADGSAVKPVLRFPLGSFGDLDRALTGGAATEAEGPGADADTPDVETPEPAPTSVVVA